MKSFIAGKGSRRTQGRAMATPTQTRYALKTAAAFALSGLTFVTTARADEAGISIQQPEPGAALSAPNTKEMRELAILHPSIAVGVLSLLDGEHSPFASARQKNSLLLSGVPTGTTVQLMLDHASASSVANSLVQISFDLYEPGYIFPYLDIHWDSSTRVNGDTVLHLSAEIVANDDAGKQTRILIEPETVVTVRRGEENLLSSAATHDR